MTEFIVEYLIYGEPKMFENRFLKNRNFRIYVLIEKGENLKQGLLFFFLQQKHSINIIRDYRPYIKSFILPLTAFLFELKGHK